MGESKVHDSSDAGLRWTQGGLIDAPQIPDGIR
jgi:hypothetical protein